MAELWVGTSGWSYQHWRGRFYPEGLPGDEWFAFYARHFRTVEINNSFYRMPKDATWEAWREQAPDGFKYAVKASRFLTHIKRLNDPAEPIERLFNGARRLGPHLGPVLYQLAPFFHCTPENLDRFAAFLALVPPDVENVVEFRHDSWYRDEVYGLLRHHDVAFCVHDMRDMHCPVLTTARTAYLRFHGPEGTYAGSYPDEKLAEWAGRIQAMTGDVDRVWVYFNNDIGGHALHNAVTLAQLLHAPLGIERARVA